jgi:hypothetical protein
LITRETVAIDTPAAWAISRMVALVWSPLPSFRAMAGIQAHSTGNGYTGTAPSGRNFSSETA